MNADPGSVRQWYLREVFGPVSARSGFLTRRLLRPNPWSSAVRRGEVHLVRPGALGDVLMCTPIFRELKRINRDTKVCFYTDFPDLVRGLATVDHVGSPADRPAAAIELRYEFSLPPRRHIARILGDCVGLRIRDVQPECPINHKLLLQFVNQWRDLPRPHVVVNRSAGGWTPNKSWPQEHWDDLVDRLGTSGTVIEVGNHDQPRMPRAGTSHVDYVGKTTLEQLVALIAAADILVSPVSGPVHIAAAVATPAVVIYGGYETPVCSSYPGNVNLYSPMECSPCWMREPCPFGKPCLSRISASAVEKAIQELSQHAEPAERHDES